MKTKVKITTTDKRVYHIELTSAWDKFKWDIALTKEECEALRDELNKKIK